MWPDVCIQSADSREVSGTCAKFDGKMVMTNGNLEVLKLGAIHSFFGFESQSALPGFDSWALKGWHCSHSGMAASFWLFLRVDRGRTFPLPVDLSPVRTFIRCKQHCH